MAEVRRSVVDYLQDQLAINTDALRTYDANPMEDDKRDPEVKSFREMQAMILRDRISEISRHAAVINEFIQMPKQDKVEYEKRVRIVQEWILEDWPLPVISFCRSTKPGA